MLPDYRIQYEAVENQGSALEREDLLVEQNRGPRNKPT